MTRLAFSANPAYLDGKQGKLQKNDKGHYKLLMGMYNAPNCMGDIYLLTQRVQNLFKASTAASWCESGRLFGEAEHPGLAEFLIPGRSTADAVAMLLDRSATVPCFKQNHQIYKFWYEDMPDKIDGKTIIGVYGEIMPLTDRFKTSLENPYTNTAMSVRSFIGNRSPTGIGNYLLEQSDIITWDETSVPGLPKVGKYTSAGFESAKYNPHARINIPEEEYRGLLLTPDVISSLKTTMEQRGGMESDCHAITQMIKDNGKWVEKPDLVATLASRAWAHGK